MTRGNQQVLNSVATNNGALLSDFGFLHMVKRSKEDSILAERLGLRKDIPRHVFQQLIAKASEDVKSKLQQERPDLAEQIQTSLTDIAGELHSKFGPASKLYSEAKRTVGAQHRDGKLNEKRIWDYARSRKFEETVVGLSLLCSLPVDVVERALLDSHRDTILILANALGFGWETAMALLFLGAKDHRISAGYLDGMKDQFARLNAKTSQSILSLYQSRKSAAAADSELAPPAAIARSSEFFAAVAWGGQRRSSRRAHHPGRLQSGWMVGTAQRVPLPALHGHYTSTNFFTGVGSRLNILAAFRPRILRLACSVRNGRSQISCGRSKS